MTEIIIDSSRCSGCKICITLCPYFILELQKEEKVVRVKPEYASYCSKCGHCEAVCPENAIIINYEGAGTVNNLTSESLPTVGQMTKLIKMRRSVRHYKNKPIPKEIFETIFDTIRYAPTGMNGQSVQWLVFQNPDDVRNLVSSVVEWARKVVKTQTDHPLAPILPMIISAWENGEDHICHNAPHLVIAYGNKDNPVAFIDAIIAFTHLDLVAPVFDLGTCWGGIVQIALNESPEILKTLDLPQDHKILYSMMIGYPNIRFKKIPKRNVAKITWR